MYKISYSVGSNNRTKKLERNKALRVLNGNYKGLSITQMVGVWENEEEKSLKAEVIVDKVDYSKVKNVCRHLNRELDQEAIMVEIVQTEALFISDR